MKTIQYFAIAVGLSFTLILLASGSIPINVGVIYLVCLAVPIIVD
jgi:hypothetical protein